MLTDWVDKAEVKSGLGVFAFETWIVACHPLCLRLSGIIQQKQQQNQNIGTASLLVWLMTGYDNFTLLS